MIIYKIWQPRNNFKYDKILLTQKTMINKINNQLRTILNAHAKNHKLNNTPNQFQDLFCVNNAIAKIESNALQILRN